MSAQVSDGALWWPSTNPSIDPSGVVVVTVNYNTKRLVSMLLWSLYRFLGFELRSVIVVDNGSSDGSTEILQACARAGLCELIPNAANRYHGPATNQALSAQKIPRKSRLTIRQPVPTPHGTPGVRAIGSRGV